MVRALPRIRYRGKEYFLDERLMELRNVKKPWDNIPLDDFEVLYLKMRHGLVA